VPCCVFQLPPPPAFWTTSGSGCAKCWLYSALALAPSSLALVDYALARLSPSSYLPSASADRPPSADGCRCPGPNTNVENKSFVRIQKTHAVVITSTHKYLCAHAHSNTCPKNGPASLRTNTTGGAGERASTRAVWRAALHRWPTSPWSFCAPSPASAPRLRACSAPSNPRKLRPSPTSFELFSLPGPSSDAAHNRGKSCIGRLWRAERLHQHLCSRSRRSAASTSAAAAAGRAHRRGAPASGCAEPQPPGVHVPTALLWRALPAATHVSRGDGAPAAGGRGWAMDAVVVAGRREQVGAFLASARVADWDGNAHGGSGT
jgi:hypothetical protein